jgi:UDP-glucose:(heptosyl)LPS alpha-1,3-glucosyltransferase
MVFSAALRDFLVDTRRVPVDRICLTSPGIDLQRFRPGADTAGSRPRNALEELRLVFAGHNFALKGLRTVLRAVARLHRNGVHCRLAVAGGDPAAPFRRLADRLGIPTSVEFHGALAQTVLADLYRTSDALVHPTFYDPFPRVVLEALASGCAVVTTRRCGASALIQHGQEGFVTDDPRDDGAVAAFLERLRDPDRLARMRARAADIGRRFPFDEHASAVWQWLKDTRD